MLRRLGQRDEARTAFERAAHLASADQRFLVRQIEGLPENGALTQDEVSALPPRSGS